MSWAWEGAGEEGEGEEGENAEHAYRASASAGTTVTVKGWLRVVP